MEINELKDLIETATEQLTADYACYFGVRDAEIIIELANNRIVFENNLSKIVYAIFNGEISIEDPEKTFSEALKFLK